MLHIFNIYYLILRFFIFLAIQTHKTTITLNGLSFLSIFYLFILFIFPFFTEFLQDAASDFKAISSSPHVRVFENGSLIIHNTQKSDAGFYLCQGRNCLVTKH